MLYSTGLWFRWDRQGEDWLQSTPTGRFEDCHHVTVDFPPRRLWRWPRMGLWDRWIMRRGVRRWLRQLSGDGPLVAYLFHPRFVEYLPLINADYVVYHAYDLFAMTPDWDSRQAAQEQRLTRLADLVLGSSESIAEGLQPWRKGKVHVLPNGADTRAYIEAADASVREPDDIGRIPHPRIGYVGNLNRKVDFPLLLELSVRRPDWQFVFVGGRQSFDSETRQALSQCERRSNIHFLGSRPRKELPRYVAANDVNMICSRVNEGLWTVASYPLKLHEYLAAGKPVVGADLRVLHDFTNVLRIAGSVDDWEQALAEAINDGGVGDRHSRRRVAEDNDWNLRVKCLDALLDEMVSPDNTKTCL